MKFITKVIPINSNIEKYIINNVKTQYNSMNLFVPFNDKSCNNLISHVNKQFNNKISCNLINSIKSAFVKQTIVKYNYRLEKNAKFIKNVYSESEELFNYKKKFKNPIELISEKYILSPLNIVRFILKNKYKKKFSKINKIELSKFDSQMLEYSIKHDEYALIDGSKIEKEAILFEKDIEKILIKHKIKYKTQEDLAKEQIKKFGKPINTPDFLILSDLYINNIKINWIDAKKFYGSCVSFVEKRIEHQTEKYLSEYGSGSIVFNLSFNENLKFNNILLLDYNSFHKMSI